MNKKGERDQHRLNVSQIIHRPFKMYHQVMDLEVTTWCQEKCLKSLPRSQMLLLLNYLLQTVMGLLQLARPQVLLTPHHLMVWANCSKIVCFLQSKCACSVYIYFILPGNWSAVFFSPLLVFVFVFVFGETWRHEITKNMYETDLLNLTM